MTDDEQRTYHHSADEGATRGPSSEGADPHHALNTPVEAVDENDSMRTEEDEGERLEAANDRAEDERTSEERTRGDRSSRE
jgi:hypothetical protein